MGQRQSKNEGFTSVLPGSQRPKPSSSTPRSPPACCPAESAVPTIDAPPHALLSQPENESSRLDTTRRGSDDGATFSVPESVRKSRTLEQFEQTCSEILPDLLFVSNLQVAQDHVRLRELGITHVVNCCKEVARFPVTSDVSITFLQLAVRDGVQEDLLPFFPQVIEFIERCRQHRGRVLVHCHQGVSRSCAFAIAYVMYKDRLGFHAANVFVKSKRSICSPNAAFICQLIEWERELSTTLSDGRGLYRLAPHAAYDPAALVLKLCYEKDLRRKILLPATSDDCPLPSTLLWPQGIYVFVDRTMRVVVWKGATCAIQNGVETAKTLAIQMLRVLAGEAAAEEMAFVVIEDSSETDDVDNVQYASELAWMGRDVQDGSVQRVGEERPVTDSVDVATVADDSKPQLFARETSSDGSTTWERLTNYDSDDLLAQHVLLLVSSQYSCVWVGSDHDAASLAKLQPEATQQARLFTTTHSELGVERQNQESDAFWEVFESGY